MNKQFKYCIIVSCFCILVSACAKVGGPCEEVPVLNQSEVIITFKNASGDYLYKELDSPYNKDSLKIFDEKGNQLILLSALNQIPNTSFRYYEISFGPVYDDHSDEQSFNNETCKSFMVKYSDNDSDTIQTCFKSAKTRCGSNFETLRVLHKGELLASVNNTTFAQIELIKP